MAETLVRPVISTVMLGGKMKKILFITLIILFSVFCSCNMNVARHNYLDAADVAKEYIEKLFVLNDYTTAYDMMADEFKEKVNQDQLKKLSIETHDTNFPKEFEIYFHLRNHKKLFSSIIL